jgi:pimeloyl-ACP methyl ester carboxylesterase
MTPAPAPDPLLPIAFPDEIVPAPDAAAVPEGFLVTADDGTRVHFLDWGGAALPDGTTAGEPTLDRSMAAAAPAALLVPGLLSVAWSWAPIARRLRVERRTVAADLRGHGLSDAPPGGYDLSTLAADLVVVAEGSGALDGGQVVLAGHGFGAMVAAAAAAVLGDRCAGLVLVDGGWERSEETTGVDVEEFLRGLDEPPEVMRTIDAWLADRRGFDPSTWDADQERAARDSVVETAAGRVVRAVRPHVATAMVRTMFATDPVDALARVRAPVTALVALASGDRDVRLVELRRAGEARVAADRDPIRVAGFTGAAHNLMRYRPAEVCSAILGAADPGFGR